MKDVLIKCLDESERILKEYFKKSVKVEVKQDRTYVTKVDVEVELAIKKIIHKHFPSHGIIGEEEGIKKGEEYTWIIDPIDGTVLFGSEIPEFATLIAVMKNNEIILAGMNFPVLDLRYIAKKGKGATMNGKPIHVTEETALDMSLFSLVGCILLQNTPEPAVKIYNNLVRNVGYVIGSNGPLHAGYVADGRIAGFICIRAKIWDIAAPSLIIQEAGGVVTDFLGEKLNFNIQDTETNFSFLATTKQFHKQALEITDLS